LSFFVKKKLKQGKGLGIVADSGNKDEFACVCGNGDEWKSNADYRLQYTATHCSTLQHTATHCNTLGAARAVSDSPTQISVFMMALKHNATHCNTLQHPRVICTGLATFARRNETCEHKTFCVKSEIQTFKSGPKIAHVRRSVVVTL